MIFLPNPASMVADVPRRIWVSIIPVFIGCLSSMMGIGGGVLMVMSLTLFNQPIHRAIGTAALFGLVISVPGTVGFMILGFEDPRLPAGNVGYVSLIGVALIAPTTVLLAPFGAKLAHKLSSRQLSMLFGVFLFVAAGKLAFAAGEFEADASFECDSCAEWNQVQEPVHIFGNTYYVGMAGVSAVVIDAGTELVLIDGGLAQSAEHIVANIRALGFDPLAISTIVSSHAHNDHAGGIAALQRFTGAQVLSSEAGARALRAGDLMRDDPLFALGYENRFFPAVPEAIAVRDAAEHHLGDVVLRGLYTPGHTPGGMSWTWESCEGDRCLDIVYADSLSAVAATGYRFADGMGDVLRSSILKVADLRCDILLVSHPFLFNLQDKAEQDRESFVDDQSCRLYAESALLQLERRLASETAE
jgi:metallo-beta-lactamase class B